MPDIFIVSVVPSDLTVQAATVFSEVLPLFFIALVVAVGNSEFIWRGPWAGPIWLRVSAIGEIVGLLLFMGWLLRVEIGLIIDVDDGGLPSHAESVWWSLLITMGAQVIFIIVWSLPVRSPQTAPAAQTKSPRARTTLNPPRFARQVPSRALRDARKRAKLGDRSKLR